MSQSTTSSELATIMGKHQQTEQERQEDEEDKITTRAITICDSSRDFGFLIGVFFLHASLAYNYIEIQTTGCPSSTSTSSSSSKNFHHNAWSLLLTSMGFLFVLCLNKLVTSIQNKNNVSHAGTISNSSTDIVTHVQGYFVVGIIFGICTAWLITDVVLLGKVFVPWILGILYVFGYLHYYGYYWQSRGSITSTSTTTTTTLTTTTTAAASSSFVLGILVGSLIVLTTQGASYVALVGMMATAGTGGSSSSSSSLCDHHHNHQDDLFLLCSFVPIISICITLTIFQRFVSCILSHHRQQTTFSASLVVGRTFVVGTIGGFVSAWIATSTIMTIQQGGSLSDLKWLILTTALLFWILPNLEPSTDEPTMDYDGIDLEDLESPMEEPLLLLTTTTTTTTTTTAMV